MHVEFSTPLLQPLVHIPALAVTHWYPAAQQPRLKLAPAHEQNVSVIAHAPTGTTSVLVTRTTDVGVASGVPGGGAMPASVVGDGGTHSDAPQVSAAGQHAVTPPKRQVGWAAAQASAHSPTPADEMQSAPEGQQPLPSAQAVWDAAHAGEAASLRGTRPPTTGSPAASGAGVIMAWRPAWSWDRAVGRRRRKGRRGRKAWARRRGVVGRMAVSLETLPRLGEGYGCCAAN